MENQQPRKRGRPPKHPKPEPTPPAVPAQHGGRSGQAGTSGSYESKQANLQKASSADLSSQDDDVDMAEDAGPARPRRGRPQKRPSSGSGKSIVVQNENDSPPDERKYALEDDEKAEKPVERSSRRSGRYRAKSPTLGGPSNFYSAPGDSGWQDDPGIGSDEVKDAPFMDAVVKVFCVHTEPNFSLPWQRKRQFSSNSSGFIISGRRVLTNAHSVEHHTQVKVKKRGSDVKYLATVLAIGTECDIGEPNIDVVRPRNRLTGEACFVLKCLVVLSKLHLVLQAPLQMF